MPMPRNFTPETKKLFQQIKAEYVTTRDGHAAALKAIDRLWTIAGDRLNAAGDDEKHLAILRDLQCGIDKIGAQADETAPR
jgi:hypothetical protein